MDVSVIVVNYFTSALCLEALKSVKDKSAGFSYEVILVDNSNDASEFAKLSEIAATFGATLINPKANLGFGKANNLGAEKAAGRYLFLLNADTYLMNNAILLLKEYMDSHPEIGVAGPNLYDKDEKPYHSFDKDERNLSSFRRENSYWSLLKRNLLKRREDFNYEEKPLELHGCVIGAALMIPRDLYMSLGGFDQRIFMFAEESLLCFRVIHEKGRSIVNLPSAKIVHLEGQSFSAGSARNKAKYWVAGNYVYFSTAFGQRVANKFLTTAKRIYRRKTFISKLTRKKEKAAYYAVFAQELQSFSDSLTNQEGALLL